MTPGQLNYQSYGEFVGWRDFRGNPIPRWSTLPEIQREGFEQAARVITQVGKRRSTEIRVHWHAGGPRTLCGLVAGGREVTGNYRDVTCKRCRKKVGK